MQGFEGFHFQHHRDEAHRSRRRFSLFASFLATLIVTLSLEVFYSTPAYAANVTVSGRVTVNGVGVPGASVYVCYNQLTVKTNSTGYWSFSIPQHTGYCARVTGGTSIWSGPLTNNNPDVGGSKTKTYEWQYSAHNCYHDPDCRSERQVWDRGTESGYDFRYSNAAPVGDSNSADCARTIGYAYDPDNTAMSSSVQILIDGARVATIVADRDRPDVNTAKKITGRHGYVYTLPSTVRNGRTHTIGAVALNTGTMGAHTTLPTRSITCAAPVVPKPPAPKPAPKPAPAPAPQTAAPVADTTAPSKPDGFTAAVADGSAIVALSWSASTDAGGIKGYRLERSLDGNEWVELAKDISETVYRDDSAAYSVRYFYRLTAFDNAGNASAPAITEATTNAFAGTSGDGNLSIISENQVLEAMIPAGAIAGEADCRLEGDPSKGTRERPIIAGAFKLLCKTPAGEPINDFSKPVVYTFKIKSAVKGYQSPQGVVFEGGNALKQEAKYSGKTGELQFQLVSARPVAVTASPTKGIAAGVAAVLGLIVMAVVGLFVFALRRRQKMSYEEYLRQKYYDL